MNINAPFADVGVKLFLDTADVAAVRRCIERYPVRGVTTNPTLARQAGVTDYEKQARTLLEEVATLPVSVQVLADELAGMEREANRMRAWGPNIVVKIPATNSRGAATHEVVRALCADGVAVNVTALFTMEQAAPFVCSDAPPRYLSVFAGRIADSGRDPVTEVRRVVGLADSCGTRVVWASPRELYNVVQAAHVGAQVITMPPGLLERLPNLGRDLDEFSLDTVRMFHRDALALVGSPIVESEKGGDPHAV